MTIINPNSIAGITSVTAQAGVMNFYKSDGTLAGLQLDGVNFNTTTGISTFNNLVVGGTLTYEDVKNVDSVGIITARAGIFVDDSITHIGDTNTKIRFPTNDTITFETSGAENVRIASTGDFTVKTGSQYRGYKLHKADGGTVAELVGFNSDNDKGGLTLWETGTKKVQILAHGSSYFTHSVGIGTVAPVEEFHLQGNTAVVALIESTGANDSRVRIKAPSNRISYLEFADDDADAGEIRYDHTNNYMGFHVNNNAERLRITSAGNVGIGSAIPEQRLTVAGVTDITHYNNSTINNNRLQLGFNAPEGYIKAKNSAASPAANLALYTTDTSGNTNKVVHCTYDGNVGISEASPQALLHLNAGANSAIMLGNTTHGYKIRANVTSSNDYGLLIEDEDGVDLYRATSSTGTANANTHTFSTAGSERFRIGDDGQITITAASGDSILHIKRSNTNTTGLTGGINFIASDNHSVASIQARGDGDNEGAHLQFYTTSAAAGDMYHSASIERLRITSTGTIQCKGETDILNNILRVTDGTPRIIMSVPSGGLDTRLYNDGGGNFIIGHGTNSDAPTERLRITSDGKMGLGTNNPKADLEVYNVGAGVTATSVVRGQKAVFAIMGDAENSGAAEDDARLVFGSDGDTDPTKILTSPLASHGFEIALINDEPGSGLRFHSGTHNAERLRISSDGKIGIMSAGGIGPNYDFDISSTSDVSMRIHRPSSGLTRTETCGLGFSQRGDTTVSTSDTRAGIFSTYNGNLFLATERAGNLNSNPEDHCRLYISGYGGASIAKVDSDNAKLPHTKSSEADFHFAGRHIWKRIESSTYVTTTASNHFKIAFYRANGTDNGASFTDSYYKGVTVNVNAGGKRDWGGHGYVTHYSKTMLMFSSDTSGSHQKIINKGFSHIDNNENNMKLSTVTYSYDSNYLYATFKFITDESGDGWDPYYNVEVVDTSNCVYNVTGI